MHTIYTIVFSYLYQMIEFKIEMLQNEKNVLFVLVFQNLQYIWRILSIKKNFELSSMVSLLL